MRLFCVRHALAAALAASVWGLGLGAQAQTNNYEIGVGIYDITGQVAETNFFGYAKIAQRNNGLRDRQYARAFIVREPNGKSVVFVNIDKGAMFQSVNEAVMAKLRALYGTRYTDNNVVISATHTHVAAGGVSHYGLYNTSTGGYWKANFDNMVEGIFQAIVRAHNDIQPGRIYYNRGSLTNASINRSLVAYQRNSDAGAFSSIDNRMTVLKFVKGTNREVGAIAWFGVHPVSLNQNWKLNSSDNKGWAQSRFEKAKGSGYGSTNAFVAAFANSAAGDMSPNLNQPPASDPYTEATGPGATGEQSLEIIGERQYQSALALYNSASQQLFGSVNFVSRYSDFSNTLVDKRWTDGRNSYQTCAPATGTSFAAGAEDGRSGIFSEGITRSDPNSGGANAVCHQEKPIFFVDVDVPRILSTTILKIGDFGILAAPGEFTIMAARRVEAAVAEVQNDGITKSVFAGYSDAYAGYVTTREEYASQQYEGASTLFGPWTAAAYAQEFNRLARKLADPTINPWPTSAPVVPFKAAPAPDNTVNVLFDDKPLSRSFGEVILNANASYRRGDLVTVRFQGGHPNLDLKVNGSYLKVQRLNGSLWTDYLFDRDQSTKFIWNRVGVSYSENEIQWRIASDAPIGSYRICHDGKWKSGWTGALTNYSGCSRTFTVN